MANATGDTGGGTTSSVCSISPSDEKAILGNLNNRVSDIERFLSQLVAADVHANNLAELARDLGNVTNGTLMLPNNPNSPWAGPGGTIPVPDGYNGSVVNGNVITTWKDGVVSVQMTGAGIVTGSGSGITKFLTLVNNSTTVGDWVELYKSGASAWGVHAGMDYVDMLESGYYFISVSIHGNVATGATNSYVAIELYDNATSTDTFYHYINHWNETQHSFTFSGSGIGKITTSGDSNSFLQVISSGITGYNNVSGSKSYITIMKISDL